MFQGGEDFAVIGAALARARYHFGAHRLLPARRLADLTR